MVNINESDLVDIAIGKYSDDKTPPVKLSSACEAFFGHVIKARSLFFYVFNLMVTAEKLDNVLEKVSGALGAQKESLSIDQVIKRKCAHTDEFYFHESFLSQLTGR